jgi:hypothetical protein
MTLFDIAAFVWIMVCCFVLLIASIGLGLLIFQLVLDEIKSYRKERK